MKKIIVSLAVTTALFSASSFAALNSYLQIKGTKGSSIVVNCPNGACTVPALTADTYSVSVVDAQGKPVAVEGKYECSVTSPRDSASGLATGKRMHKPFVITKELNSSTLEVAQDETNLAIACISNPVSPTAAEVKGNEIKAEVKANELKANDAKAKVSTYDLKEAKK